MIWLRVLPALCVVLLLPTQVFSSIGKVLSIKPGAEITRAGETIRIREGMEVASGDTIATDNKGVVQLIFVDETKIAIGPNAHMVLDVTMLRGKNKAKSFAVQALGGSFRFISGKSRKRAYSIRTPTATMAVRGTTFDMWIDSDRQSAMLVLEGTVRMCSLRGGCRSTGRQCSLFATSQRGNIGRPIDRAEYDKALQQGFPFIQSQERLLRPFQVAAEGCSGDRAPQQVSVQTEHSEQQPSPPQREAERVAPATATAAAPSSPEPPAPAQPDDMSDPHLSDPEPAGQSDPGANTDSGQGSGDGSGDQSDGSQG
ncbi:FecR family protein [Ruegeria arenilitoris]|uniref:FecR family protein n=1 Tax=Ruegeria arenilitoris TaxID=1173585 RepID=UPI0020C2CFB7|nr:FecR domain-containing protein [Ruegeria arenilitoris]